MSMKATAKENTSSEPTELRPGIANPWCWYPNRLSKQKWEALRRKVLKRDDYSCCLCGHRATKWMNVHHLSSNADKPSNLKTVCVACHAVLHFGLNLQYRKIEIWESRIPQVEIVKRTRAGVASGKSLAQIKRTLPLTRGRHSPKSLKYANDLIKQMGDLPRAFLRKPLCVVFVKLKRWQIE